jgi:hypothetical protein
LADAPLDKFQGSHLPVRAFLSLCAGSAYLIAAACRTLSKSRSTAAQRAVVLECVSDAQALIEQLFAQGIGGSGSGQVSSHRELLESSTELQSSSPQAPSP